MNYKWLPDQMTFAERLAASAGACWQVEYTDHDTKETRWGNPNYMIPSARSRYRIHENDLHLIMTCQRLIDETCRIITYKEFEYYVPKNPTWPVLLTYGFGVMIKFNGDDYTEVEDIDQCRELVGAGLFHRSEIANPADFYK